MTHQVMTPLRITRRQCLATLVLSVAFFGMLLALKYGSAVLEEWNRRNEAEEQQRQIKRMERDNYWREFYERRKAERLARETKGTHR